MNNFYTQQIQRQPFILAPMAGYTDAPFRRLALDMGASWAVSEMVSARGICENSPKTLELAQPVAGERMVLQLFGDDPEQLAAAATTMQEQFHFPALDLNMGCPVPKLKGRGGACLLQTPEQAYLLVRALVKAVDVPISVKMRLGWDSNQAIELARGIEQAGASLIALHGRTSTQRYSGEANWHAIAETAAQVSIPVVGSGDVQSHDEAVNRLSMGISGVMIARAAVGNPWVFSGKIPSLAERIHTAWQHAKSNVAWYGEHLGMLRLRKVLPKYFPASAAYHTSLCQVSSLNELDTLLTSIHKSVVDG